MTVKHANLLPSFTLYACKFLVVTKYFGRKHGLHMYKNTVHSFERCKIHLNCTQGAHVSK